jgi:hypothetical protein
MNRRRQNLRWPVTEECIEAAVQQAIRDGFVPRLKPSQPLYKTSVIGEMSPMGDCWNFGIDWSIDSATLTIDRSFREGGVGSDYPLENFKNIYNTTSNWGWGINMLTPRDQILPNSEQTKEMMRERIPATLLNTPWYHDQIEDIVVYGPVFYRRYEANIHDAIKARLGYDSPLFLGEDLRFDILALPADPARGFDLDWIIEATHSNMDREECLGLEAARAARNTLYEFLGGVEGGNLLTHGGLRTTAVLDRFKNR